MTHALVAVDDSESSVEAALFALDVLGEATRFTAVTVAPLATTALPRHTPVGSTYPLHLSEWTDVDRQRMRERAESLARTAGLDDADAIGEIGDPVATIKRTAQELDVDVIVVGTAQRSWWQRLFEPSVSAGVVEHTDRPVLVVPSTRASGP